MISKFFRKLKKQKSKEEVKVNKSMRDYSKEEFFVKKAAKAQEMLNKYGLPKELTTYK